MAGTAPGAPSPPQRRWVRNEILPLLLLLLLLGAARSSFANHYHVPSSSMEPTLEPGDRVLVDMSAYGLRLPFTKIRPFTASPPRPGDVAIFDSPSDGVLMIKRVVAVAGDQVELFRGSLSINGQRLAGEVRADTEHFGDREVRIKLDRGGGPDIMRMQVPEGHVLVLGDYRGNSVDSRYYGLIATSELYGRATRVYYRRNEGFVWRPL
ncbi:signal peptidase I [Alkalisalibacterium limincola]|uniref:Signal peptidase I n=1 Tax=Alkalisalibacterium limincola TaxID=2699169 RepID=A0A5C8KY33_9GAMM|nr:signal peptidase I [Alkalisalibacterium limincola]TXK65726.1 signal peptidase I [Alkalisalibacterium limincola]